MPRYFFHLYNDLDAFDEEGRDLSGPEAAHDAAVFEARAVMMENVQKGHIDLDHRIDILDEGGNVVESVAFREALTVRG